MNRKKQIDHICKQIEAKNSSLPQLCLASQRSRVKKVRHIWFCKINTTIFCISQRTQTKQNDIFEYKKWFEAQIW